MIARGLTLLPSMCALRYQNLHSLLPSCDGLISKHRTWRSLGNHHDILIPFSHSTIQVEVGKVQSLLVPLPISHRNVTGFFCNLGFTTYLSMEHDVEFPPSQYWTCALSMTVLFTAILCSTLLILSMTFDRFYSIIRPHKAASFNTVKRAKITIVCIIIFSIIYNIPHLVVSVNENRQCLPYGKAMEKSYGQMYYWLSFVVNFALPFVLLLSMNTVIIHKIRKRTTSTPQVNTGTKTQERQVFLILLLVTFGFLILTTPAYIFFLYVMFVNFFATPRMFAGYYLFYNVAQKMQFSNYGINFFLYVMSGSKFRIDLNKLFECNAQPIRNSSSNSTEAISVIARKTRI